VSCSVSIPLDILHLDTCRCLSMSASTFVSMVPIGDRNAYEIAEFALDAMLKQGWRIIPNERDEDSPAAEQTINGIQLRVELWWTDNAATGARSKAADATDMVLCVQSMSYQRASKELLDKLRDQLTDAITARMK
jgi:hypothetical protein